MFPDLDDTPALKSSIMSLTSPNGHLGFMFTSQEGVVPYKLDAFRRELMAILDGKRTVREIIVLLCKKNPKWEKKRILKELDYLYTNALLEPDTRICDLGPDPLIEPRLDRQLNYLGVWAPQGRKAALEYQQRLSSAHVVVIGIGGFGSHVLCGLCYLSVGNITIVDFDRVQPSNLNRQILFDETHLGRLKTEAAQERCQAINSSINYRFINQKITGAEDFVSLIQDGDLVVMTADSPRQKIFSWMNQASFATNTPVLYTLGISPESVKIGPLVVPGQTPCFDCAMPSKFLDADKEPARTLNQQYRHGSIEPYLMTGAGLMLNEITAHLTQIRPCRLHGAMLSLNMHTYESLIHQISPQKGCRCCSHLDKNADPNFHGKE